MGLSVVFVYQMCCLYHCESSPKGLEVPSEARCAEYSQWARWPNECRLWNTVFVAKAFALACILGVEKNQDVPGALAAKVARVAPVHPQTLVVRYVGEMWLWAFCRVYTQRGKQAHPTGVQGSPLHMPV